MDSPQLTALLGRMDEGDSAASEELYSLVYDVLHARAGQLLGRQGGNTLQATALVHEAWLKLCGPAGQGLESSAHFLGVAAKAMRSVLVDHARAKASGKRVEEAQRVVLDEALAIYDQRVPDLLALHDELEELGALDPQLAQIVELRFFAGLTIDETARVLGVGHATVERGWASARAFLASRLEAGSEEHGSD